MQITVKHASLTLVSGHPNQIRAGFNVRQGDVVIPTYKDDFGDSSSIRVVSKYSLVKIPTDEVSFGGICATDDEGAQLWHLDPGDKLTLGTAHCVVTGEVNFVDETYGNAQVHLNNVTFTGPWRNFNDGELTQFTFGEILWDANGEEMVEATEFRGTLDEYRHLRENEEAAIGRIRRARGDSSLIFTKEGIAERRRKLCPLMDPAQERAEQLAEELGM